MLLLAPLALLMQEAAKRRARSGCTLAIWRATLDTHGYKGLQFNDRHMVGIAPKSRREHTVQPRRDWCSYDRIRCRFQRCFI